MALEREQFVEDLKGSYEIYYDLVTEGLPEDLPLAFRADFHSRAERYFLVKSAKIWGAETNEFVYIYSAPAFDPETIDSCVKHSLDEGLSMVKPHKEHNYSNVIILFIADSVDEQAARHIKKQRFSKSYRHSLHGYTLLKTAYIDLSTEKYETNKEGHDLAKFFKQLFSKKDSSIISKE